MFRHRTVPNKHSTQSNMGWKWVLRVTGPGSEVTQDITHTGTSESGAKPSYFWAHTVSSCPFPTIQCFLRWKGWIKTYQHCCRELFSSLRKRYTLNQHKQYREVITIFLNKNTLTDAISATFTCGHICIEVLLFGEVYIFLTEEETKSSRKDYSSYIKKLVWHALRLALWILLFQSLERW